MTDERWPNGELWFEILIRVMTFSVMMTLAVIIGWVSYHITRIF